MEAVKITILSVLITLSGWLNEGLKSFEAKKYDSAISHFTKVIEKDIPENRNQDIALYYRAKSYSATNKKEKATADCLNIIKKYPNSPFVKNSRKLYLQCGGDIAKLAPKDSPKEVLKKFLAAFKIGDKATLLSISTGEIANKIKKDSSEELIKKSSHEIIKIGKEKIGKGEKSDTATVESMVKDKTVLLNFKLDKKKNKWIISGFDKEHKRIRVTNKTSSSNNINNLKQIGLACRMYSNVNNEKFPLNLKALETDGFLENKDVYLWTDGKTKKKHRFIYAPGHTEADSVEMMLAAAPKEVYRKREVLYIDGHVKSIPEVIFIKNAQKQKWKLQPLLKKENIPKDKQKRASELIKQLADSKFNVRQKAKLELIEMGDDAVPFLEENKNHRDPEVKMAIKAILEE